MMHSHDILFLTAARQSPMFKGSIGVLNSSENKIEATEHVCMYVCMDGNVM